MTNKNVQKHKARPKRSIKAPGEDHPLGLWIDKDLLRKHHTQVQTTTHEPLMASSQRYLELADLALEVNKPNGKPKKKAKAASAE
ncbi:MAG TPA: hypothetical protein VJT08_21310 [Terriglobales bacterium]|nr:hypothetical protein [Terriglobales bacterium]